MKKFLIVLVVFFIGIAPNYAQRQCITPISNYVFQQKMSQIEAKTTESQKLIRAKKVAKNNCLSTVQVKRIAEVFSNDYQRLDFVQTAYARVTDKANFYDVYDSFAYFSTVFRLHDFIQNKNNSGGHDVVDNGGSSDNQQINFPNYNYPNYNAYHGEVGCRRIMDKKQFRTHAKRVKTPTGENQRLMIALNLAQNYCLTTAQVMKISSLLSIEKNRLDFAKQAYASVYDLGNYGSVSQVFRNPYNRSEFMRFWQSRNTRNTPACKVSASEFQAAKAQIKKQAFNNTKLNMAKQIFRSKKCFTVNQVKQVVSLFTFADTRLKFAKFAYEYTINKNDYYQVTEVLKFDSDKEKLLTFLKSKK